MGLEVPRCLLTELYIEPSPSSFKGHCVEWPRLPRLKLLTLHHPVLEPQESIYGVEVRAVHTGAGNSESTADTGEVLQREGCGRKMTPGGQEQVRTSDSPS